MIRVELEVNGRWQAALVEERETLLEFVRRRLGLCGAKRSCDIQVCGACTLLVDDLPVSACTYLACEADGRRIRTVEGLAGDNGLHPLQQAFIEHAAFQCGFCTSGMLLSAVALLEHHPRPEQSEVVDWLKGNICRCTGYRPIVEAVMTAAARMAGADSPAVGEEASAP